MSIDGKGAVAFLGKKPSKHCGLWLDFTFPYPDLQPEQFPAQQGLCRC